MGTSPKKGDEKGRRKDSVFTKDQEIWIVKKFHQNVSTTQIVRDFRKDFSIKSFRNIPSRMAFHRVFKRFQTNGIAPVKKEAKKKTAIAPITKKVVAFFKKNPHSSLRQASRKLPFGKTRIHETLKKRGFHPYKPSVGQILTDDQKLQRLEFDSWLQICITITPDFLQIVAFSDEKWFFLHQAPNRQNYRQWSKENPHEILGIKKQGDVKIMCFLCVVDGVILEPYWFEDSNGKSISVNTDEYIKMLKNHTISQLKKFEIFKTKKMWWQQDGATCHTSDKSLDFLREHFGDRIISRRADVIWPSSSPDHNPLDYSL